MNKPDDAFLESDEIRNAMEHAANGRGGWRNLIGEFAHFFAFDD